MSSLCGRDTSQNLASDMYSLLVLRATVLLYNLYQMSLNTEWTTEGRQTMRFEHFRSVV